MKSGIFSDCSCFFFGIYFQAMRSKQEQEKFGIASVRLMLKGNVTQDEHIHYEQV